MHETTTLTECPATLDCAEQRVSETMHNISATGRCGVNRIAEHGKDQATDKSHTFPQRHSVSCWCCLVTQCIFGVEDARGADFRRHLNPHSGSGLQFSAAPHIAVLIMVRLCNGAIQHTSPTASERLLCATVSGTILPSDRVTVPKTQSRPSQPAWRGSGTNRGGGPGKAGLLSHNARAGLVEGLNT